MENLKSRAAGILVQPPSQRKIAVRYCVCVCANFPHYLLFVKLVFDIPIVSTAYLISPLYRLYPHPKSIPILQSVPSTASRAQVQLDWTAPSTEDLDLCVRGINLAGEEVAQMRLSKEDRPGSRERCDRVR